MTNTIHLSLKSLSLTCFLMLSGCAINHTLPESGRLADVHEAYPDSASMVPPVDKRDAYERALLRAPLTVVYRAALESASEIMRIVSSDKEQGVILGSTTTGATTGRLGVGESRYFFAIRLSEKGPERTELLIMAKAQAICTHSNPSGAGNFMAAGLLTGPMLNEQRYCEAVSRIHWAGEADGVGRRPHASDRSLSQKALLERLVGAVRAKAIKAGYE